jgi:hypothetical protein
MQLSIVFGVGEGSVATGSAAGVEVSHSPGCRIRYLRLLLRILLRLVTFGAAEFLISAANAVTRWPVFWMLMPGSVDASLSSLIAESC